MSESIIGFIGGGRVTRIMLTGWDRADALPTSIVVSDADAESLSKLVAAFPTLARGENALAGAQDIVFLAVHPPVIGDVLAEVKGTLRADTILVSLAPKLTISKLSDMLGRFTRIARVIPNAPSIVGKGFNPIAFGAGLTESDRTGLMQLLAPLGEQLAELIA